MKLPSISRYLDKYESFMCDLLAESVVPHGDLIQRWGELDENLLFKVAERNLATSVIGHFLDRLSSQIKVSQRWRIAHDKTDYRIRSYLEELDRIAAKLARENIPLVALKNGGIARGIYPCPGCCPMGDLDVLVKRKDFREAHEVLLQQGYKFQFRSILEKPDFEAAMRNGGAEYWKALQGGEKLWLELQWRPIAGRWIRPDQEPSADDLINRSVSIPGTAVRLLSPEDNLLQVSLHTVKHSYIRAPGFRLHLDVERIVRYQTIDWEVFLQRVVSLEVKTSVYFSLLIPHLFFDTPIPDFVLACLGPSQWKAFLVMHWLKGAGFFNPDERKFGRLSYVIFKILLYDDVKGLIRAIIPEASWMKKNYELKSSALLPFFYLARLGNLAFRRLRT
jgi:hypothetical protein